MQHVQKTSVSLLAGMVLAVVLAMPAAGQTALFDDVALTTACSQASCVDEVTVILSDMRALDLAEPEFNSQVGFLAALLLQGAETADPAAVLQLSAGFEVLAQNSTDARQAAAIRQVAQSVAQGKAATVAASAPYAASPSQPFKWWNRPRRPFRSDRFRGPNRNPWFGFWRR